MSDVVIVLASLFGVPLIAFGGLAFAVNLMQTPRRRAEADLEACITRGDAEGAKALLVVRGELLNIDSLEEAERWIEAHERARWDDEIEAEEEEVK